MSNQSSEYLKVNYVKGGKPRYQDMSDIQLEQAEIKKEKKEKLDHLYNENYQPAKYSKALAYRNARSYKKKLPNG